MLKGKAGCVLFQAEIEFPNLDISSLKTSTHLLKVKSGAKFEQNGQILRICWLNCNISNAEELGLLQLMNHFV